MSNTPNLNLPKISGNMTADVVRDLNALADAVDASVIAKNLTTLTGVSLNTATTTGFYFADSTCTDLPASGANYFLQVIRGSNGYVYQIAFQHNSDTIYYRRYTTSWQTWFRVATLTDLNSYVGRTANIISSDLNTLTNSGFYYITTSATNAPNTGREYLLMQIYYSSTYKAQIAIDRLTSDFYVRTYNGSAWTAWKSTTTKADDLEILYWMGAI